MNSICKTVSINDELIEIPRLTLSDLFAFGDYITAQREIVARQIAKEEKIDVYETLNLVMEIRARKPTVNEILQLSGSAEGAFKIIEKSLYKAKFDAAKVKSLLDSILIPDAVDLARSLVLDIQETPVKKEDERKVPQENSFLENTSSSSSVILTDTTVTEKHKKSKSDAKDKVAYYGMKTEPEEPKA